jgi:CheY-like chemotaxis protein
MLVIGEASDGEEALRLAHAQLPDVAVLDLAMPRLRGDSLWRGIASTSII